MDMEHVRMFSFERTNDRGKPSEDYSWVGIKESMAFAVADGVSRSQNPVGVCGEVTSQDAARVFCHRAAFGLARQSILQDVFKVANEGIEQINKSVGITPETVDYLDRDYLCCTAVAGVLIENPKRFAYGCIGDCGVFVYGADDRFKFLSENNVSILEALRDGKAFASKDERRVYWRKEMRNRPGPAMTYGALTGESEALIQVKYGYVDLEAGDTVILFSDGMYPFILDEGFRAMVTRLLKSGLPENEMRALIGYFVSALTQLLWDKGIDNLDDDKTMIAFRV